LRQAIMTVAGSDPSGGAGIQQDIRVFTCLGLHACAAVTAITVQNTKGVEDVYPIPGDLVKRQVIAVFEDIRLKGIKIGMLATKDNVTHLAKALFHKDDAWVVADPVMRSKNNVVLLEKEAWRAYEEELLPLIDIITPNIHEASVMVSMELKSLTDIKMAAKTIYEKMVRLHGSKDRCGVYLKGGHIEDRQQSTDVFCYEGRLIVLRGKRIHNIHSHGTGCTLSSALCAYLVLGKGPEAAARYAKEFVRRAIVAGFPLGKGIGPVDPLVCLKF